MKKFINDVRTATPLAREEASRELWITLVISMGTFFIGPLIFAMLILPGTGHAASLFDAFTGADIYIAAVSLLSISVYSISKEYKSEGRDRFGFPHATTIMASTVLILLVAFTAYTTRIIYEAIPDALTWRSEFSATLGWLVFFVACAVAYAVLVLRNDIESGGLSRARAEEEDFVQSFTQGGGVDE